MSRGVAAISGAASGVGAAAVTALADAGFAIVGVDLAERPGGFDDVERLVWVRGDVSSPETWESAEAACTAIDPHGASAFVACAADVVVHPLLETPAEDWRRLFDINVVGVVLGMQALMPAMVERRRGAVAVTCSVNSMFVESDIGAYSASKAALLSVARTAALEHARHGVRVNAVCPAVVDTPLLNRHLDSLPDPEEARLALRRSIPSGEIMSPEEVAAVIRFLVSEEASGLSGSAVVADGGVTTTYGFSGGLEA